MREHDDLGHRPDVRDLVVEAVARIDQGRDAAEPGEAVLDGRPDLGVERPERGHGHIDPAGRVVGGAPGLAESGVVDRGTRGRARAELLVDDGSPGPSFAEDVRSDQRGGGGLVEAQRGGAHRGLRPTALAQQPVPDEDQASDLVEAAFDLGGVVRGAPVAVEERPGERPRREEGEGHQRHESGSDPDPHPDSSPGVHDTPPAPAPREGRPRYGPAHG